MAKAIIPRVHRGCLYFEVGPALFPSFAEAVCAWSAAEAHRFDVAEGVSS